MLFNDDVDQILLNDADYHIYAFWQSILNHSESFIQRLLDTEISIDEWNFQRRVYDDYSSYSLLDVGFSTFFLNRTNRGGILPKAGPTGGKTQSGSYKIDARFKKQNLIPRIEKIASNRDRITFFNLDAIDFINYIELEYNLEDTLLYLDPPYYEQGKHLYLNFYNDNDHQILSERLRLLRNSKWIVTYDNVKPIRDLYTLFKKCKFDINYSVQSTKKGNEVMFFSDSLSIPKEIIIENREYNLS